VELQDYLRAVRTSWRLIAATVLVVMAVAAGLSYSATPAYRATTQLFVSVRASDSTADLLQGSSFSQRQVKSYAAMVSTPVVLQPVVDELGLDRTAAELAHEVTATSPADTVLIDIAVTDPDPELAAATAAATAASFAVVVADLESPADGSGSPVKVSVVRPAAAPTTPTTPDHRLDLALGLLAGIVLGFGLALLRRALDTRVRDAKDIAAVTPASVLGTISEDPHGSDRPLIVQSDPHSQRAEAYRRLRTNLQFLRLDGDARTIVVTSTVPDEGKSTSAANLAIALADAGSRVVLVDADLRRPSIARYLGLEGAVGLTTVLIGQATLEDVLQPWGNGFLDVLPSGQVPPNPSEILGSAAMGDLLAELARRYDLVLLDSPPLLPVTDAAVLSTQAAGTLLVVGADRVNRRQLADAVGSLDSVRSRLLGVVLNRVSRVATDSAYGAYGSYAPDVEAGAGPGAAVDGGDAGRAQDRARARRPWRRSRAATPAAEARRRDTEGADGADGADGVGADVVDGPATQPAGTEPAGPVLVPAWAESRWTPFDDQDGDHGRPTGTD
jgi:capsular exopolysaccharide synthesis family protein